MVWDFDSGSMSIPRKAIANCEKTQYPSTVSTEKPETEQEPPAKKTVTKKVTEKAATVKKTAVRKTSSRKTVSLNTEVYVQWLGKEVYERDIIENIKKVWTEEMGKKESEHVDLKIYIKPEDNGAHYVINGDITGFIEL